MHCGALIMNEPISSTHQYLLVHYGPLLTLKHLAEVLHSTPNGVRMAITRKRQPFAVALTSAKRQFGRRVYFEASRVAEIIDTRTANGDSYPQRNPANVSCHDAIAEQGA